MTGDSSCITSSNYVKGIFISKFDLSLGPKPITRYPTDFITEEQANQLAMQSMVQLNSSKGRTVDIVLTLDDIDAIGFGTLGTLPTLGNYSFIVFFDIKAPRIVSERISKILVFLADLNAKLVDCPNPDDSFAEEVYTDTCRMLDKEFEQQHRVRVSKRSMKQVDLVMGIVGAMKPVIEKDFATIKAMGAPLARSLKGLLNRLNEVATNLNLPDFQLNLHDLLLRVNQKEGTQ